MIGVQFSMRLVTHVGMLSKSKGQVLRVAAVLHVLSYIKVQNDDSAVETQQSDELASVISESAIKAAVNFVSLCCQQTAYMTGRGNIKEEVEMLKTSMLYLYLIYISKYIQ